MSLIKLTHESINPYKLISDYEKANCDAKTIGGECIFIGYMRSNNSTRQDVASMDLEFYPKMTSSYLKNLSKTILTKYKLENILIAHRVGRVFPGDCIVVVCCWSMHRKESIEAVKIVLEDLKHNAPLWKKEHFNDKTSAWVEKNT